MSGLPTLNDLQKYSVNTDGWEVIRTKLYDSAAYLAAGASVLSFFAQPVGQGAAVLGGGVKTISDTNMVLAGQLPTNQQFLVESIEVDFFPTTPTVAAAMPAAYGAGAVAALVNDEYIFRRAGNLQFIIGSKPYLQEAPLAKFPPKTQQFVTGAASDASTAAAAQNTRIARMVSEGRPYMMKPVPLVLTSNQNFSISLNWPEGAQAITNPAKVVVSLDGFLYRRAQ